MHPKYWLVFLLTVLNFVQVVSEEVPSIEFKMDDSDGRVWKIGYEDKTKDQHISQYILKTETMATPTQMVTVQIFTDKLEAPKEYFEVFVNDFKTSLSQTLQAKIDSKIINEDNDSLLGEWNIQGDPDIYRQHGWIRIFRKDSYLGVLYFYTTRKNEADKMRPIWEKILMDAKFVIKEEKSEPSSKK